MLENTYIQIKDYLPPMTLTYASWVIIHFVCSHLYIHFCVGDSVVDIFLSPFRSSSIHCQALSWTTYTLSKQFVTVWISLASYACGKLMLENK